MDPISVGSLILAGYSILQNREDQKQAKKDAWTRLAVGGAVGAVVVGGAKLLSSRNKGKK